MIGPHADHRRAVLVALPACPGAAQSVAAAGAGIDQAVEVVGADHLLADAAVGLAFLFLVEQPAGVGVQGMVDDLLGGASSTRRPRQTTPRRSQKWPMRLRSLSISR